MGGIPCGKCHLTSAEIVLENVKLDIKIPEKNFTKAYLERK